MAWHGPIYARNEEPILNNENQSSSKSLITLPSHHAAQELITRSLRKPTENNMDIEEVIPFFSHSHPLTLSKNLQQTQKETVIGKEEVICDICVDPISNSDLYYSCVYCGYLVHVTCVRLPYVIFSWNLKDHRITLKIRANNGDGSFSCYVCQMMCNGLCYIFEGPDKFFCIKCAILVTAEAVVHNAHKQHLLKIQAAYSNVSKICNSCGRYTKGFWYGCHEKCRFYLCTYCALLPPSTKQRWDEHQLILIYRPYYDHPDEFYCVICEEEIDPNYWMYHCKECDYSFHVWCIPQIGLFRHFKFGRIRRVDNHPHPLTHVVEAKYKSYCEGCRKRLDWEKAFECDACSFYLCPHCAEQKKIQERFPNVSYHIHLNQDEVDGCLMHA